MVTRFTEAARFIKVTSFIVAANCFVVVSLQLIKVLLFTKQPQVLQLEWVNHSKAFA